MEREKAIHWSRIESELQRIFVIRVNEEMANHGLTDNALADRCRELGYDIGQSSVSRITGGRQNPSLEKVHAIARGLDIPAWRLFQPSSGVARAQVIDLPTFPEIMKQSESGHKTRLSKRRRKAKGIK